MAKILVTETIAEEGLEALRAYGPVDVKLGLGTEGLVKVIGDYEALLVRSQIRVSAEVIEAGKKLQVIGRAGVGVDNIDLEAATRCGIVVVNAPTGNIISTAEHTIALLLALARHIPQASASLKAGKWERNDFIGTEVRNKTLGIVGLGRVGSEVARRAKGLEMRLLACDPFVSPQHVENLGVRLVSLKELLQRSDFITIHASLTSATKGLIGPKELALAKPTAYFINTARGGIIDEEALYHAVEERRVAGAAIDVFTKEPALENILLQSPRIITTPHLAASTLEAQSTVAVDVAEQVIAVLKGEPAKYAVNVPLIPPETLATVGPFVEVASYVGRLVTQLAEGQLGTIAIKYEGEIAQHDISALKAAAIGGLLQPVTEERVTLVNAGLIAQSRGLKIMEEKEALCEDYSSLLTVQMTTSAGVTTVAGTHLRGQTHIVRVNDFWVDVVPTGGYWLFSDHRDRPGLIGAVGNVTGSADINISSMQLARLKPRGQALMILALDEPLGEKERQKVLAILDIYTAKVVKL